MERWKIVGAIVAALTFDAGCVDRSVPEELPVIDADVDDLPAGDAVGTDFSGTYEITARIARCEGVCEYREEGGGTGNRCQLGKVSDEQIILAQDGGRLHVELVNEPTEFSGGINSDGSFDVVGTTTENNEMVRGSTRVTGDVDPDGTLEAFAGGHLVGAMGVSEIDCTITWVVEGQKI